MKQVISVFALAMLSVVAANSAVAAGTEGPSFPCDGRLTATERVICHDPHLSDLDRSMARFYYATKDLSSRRMRAQIRAQIRAEQRLWLRWRDTCGPDRGCLQRRYEQRIIDLAPPSRLPPGFGCHPDGPLDVKMLPSTT